MQYGCIGEKLGHSFSAQIHEMLDSHPYRLCELAPDALGDFMRAADFRGINVTIPYKQAVLPYLDKIGAAAGEIGAVNTVVNQNGVLCGYNTDFDGLKTLLLSIGVPLSGRTVAILGTGGTSLTARAVAQALGAGEILRVSRRAGEGSVTYEELYCVYAPRVAVLINTTPVGMYPKTDGCPVDLNRLPALEAVADAVYNPLRTRLVLGARSRGIPAAGGLLMLTAQAVRASELFLDKSYPAGTAERIFAVLAEKKENLVLSGMPGSGKSTVGALLARRTGRPFLDLDAEITKRVSLPPAELIRTQGEAAFRALERDVLREVLAGLSGAVLAMGGGTVLRPENVEDLRQNGKIYFLDRPVSELTPTADRPLSATRAELERRYAERINCYLATADVRVSGFGTPEEAAEIIERDRRTL